VALVPVRNKKTGKLGLKDTETGKVKPFNTKDAIEAGLMTGDVGEIQPDSQVLGLGQEDSAMMLNLGGTVLKMGNSLDRLTTDPEQRQQALESSQEIDQTLAPIQEQNPISSIVGQGLPLAIPAASGVGTMPMLAAESMVGALADTENPVRGAGFTAAGERVARMITGLAKKFIPARDVRSALPKKVEDIALELEGSKIVDPITGQRRRVKFTPGQMKGTTQARSLEAKREELPISGKALMGRRDDQQLLLNQKVAEGMGINPGDLDRGRLTRKVIKQRKETLGPMYKNVSNRAQVDDMDQLADYTEKLRGAAASADEMLLELPIDKKVMKLAEGLEDSILKDGNLTGAELFTAQSRLGKMANAAKDGEAKHLLRTMQNATLDLIRDNMDQESVKIFNGIRQQWRNISAVKPKNIINAQGNVSAANLRGRGSTRDVEEVLDVFAQPGFPNSGTARRASNVFDQGQVAQGAVAGGVVGDLPGAAAGAAAAGIIPAARGTSAGLDIFMDELTRRMLGTKSGVPETLDTLQSLISGVSSQAVNQ